MWSTSDTGFRRQIRPGKLGAGRGQRQLGDLGGGGREPSQRTHRAPDDEGGGGPAGDEDDDEERAFDQREPGEGLGDRMQGKAGDLDIAVPAGHSLEPIVTHRFEVVGPRTAAGHE